MIQKSLSPVVKSRISSFAGSTISVEKRIFARMGMMSVWEQWTTLAVQDACRRPQGRRQQAIKNALIATAFVDLTIYLLLRFCPGQDLQAFLEAVLFKSFFSLAVVERVVGIEPVAFGIDFQVRHLGDIRVLDEHLALGNQG